MARVNSFSLFHFFQLCWMSLLRTIDVELFSRVVREASVGRQSDDLCNCESVTPTFGRLVDEALFLLQYCF
jgi:hypothetical protein